MNIEQELAGLQERPARTIRSGVALGTGLADGYRLFDSPVGEVMVVFNLEGVSAVDLADDGAEARFLERFNRPLIEARPPKGWDVQIGRAIERGTPGELHIDFRSVTEFQRSVLSVTATIPHGEVRPYGWLAKEIGNPGAVRAVGSTMAQNPVPLIVPCHRVVRSDGHLGAYSLGGAHNKWYLLEHEGAHPDRLEAMARQHVRYIGSRTSGTYHLPTCHEAEAIPDLERLTLRTSDAAGGLRPCPACRP